MRNNRKGFTLVELLAVIVILAVVMLIAVTSVGPMMEKSRKGALATEGVAMVDAAKQAFSAEQMNSSSAIKATSTVCFDYSFLKGKNYLEGKDGYAGSVLVKRNAAGTFEYVFWLTNKTYTFGLKDGSNNNIVGVNPNNYDADTMGHDYAANDEAAVIGCPGSSGVTVNCTGSACTAA